MFHTFDELAVIYNKILDVTATEQEKWDLEVDLRLGCMVADGALKIIQKKAEELRLQSYVHTDYE